MKRTVLVAKSVRCWKVGYKPRNRRNSWAERKRPFNLPLPKTRAIPPRKVLDIRPTAGLMSSYKPGPGVILVFSAKDTNRSPIWGKEGSPVLDLSHSLPSSNGHFDS